MRKSKGKGRGSCCPLTSSKRKRSAANKLAAMVKESLPRGLAQPALRALAAAGYTNLDQCTKVKEQELLKLHGMGPKAIKLNRAALKSAGQSFLQ